MQRADLCEANILHKINKNIHINCNVHLEGRTSKKILIVVPIYKLLVLCMWCYDK